MVELCPQVSGWPGGWALFDRKLFTEAVRIAKRERRITATAALVAAELARYADRQGVCWPGMARLAAGVGCAVRSVQRAIQQLRSQALLSWRPRKLRWNRAATHVYTLCPQARPVACPQREKETLRGSAAPVSDGSAVARALARLGAVLGVAPGQVAPWLRV